MSPSAAVLRRTLASAAAASAASVAHSARSSSARNPAPASPLDDEVRLDQDGRGEKLRQFLHSGAPRLIAGSEPCHCDAAVFRSAPSQQPSVTLKVRNTRPSVGTIASVEASGDAKREESARSDSGAVRLKRRRTAVMLRSAAERTSVEDNYEIDPVPLGEGAYGEVFEATHRTTGEKLALKKIFKDRTDKVEFQREMDALLHLRRHGGHPNICMLRENFDEQDEYVLILDLVKGGELFDHLIENGAYSEADAARLVREVASALDFCHAIGIVHADLKPENIMLSSRTGSAAAVKVVDFGCSEILPEFDQRDTHGDCGDSSNAREMSPGSIGGSTPAYCPPEAFDEEEAVPLGPSIDMWSLGVIVYMMLTGVHPFDVEGNATDEQVEKNIREIKSPPLHGSPYTSHLSQSALDLLSKLLHLDPKKRLSAHEMLQHPWVLGRTASQDVMRGSDKRLSRFRKLKTQIGMKVFKKLVDFSNDGKRRDLSQRGKSLMERAFIELDKSKTGTLTLEDLENSGIPEATADGDMSTDEETCSAALSLSNFSDLLGDNMKQRFFPRGHVVFHEGDHGDRMYFINSGECNVYTADGFAAQLGHGDTFGIGGLLESHKRRSATIKCATPVHVIEIDEECFRRYLEGSNSELALRLKEKVIAHRFGRAVHYIGQQEGLTDVSFEEGDVIFDHGEESDAVYIIENGRVDLFAEGDNKMFSLKTGDLLGFPSFIVDKPRTSLAICTSSDGCDMKRMDADKFRKLLESSTKLRNSLREVGLRREFQRAVVLKTKRSFPTESEMREVFDSIDTDRTGHLGAKGLRELILHLDSSLTETEVKELINSMNLNGTETLSFDEFKGMFSGNGF